MAVPIAQKIDAGNPEDRSRPNQDPLAIRHVLVRDQALERFALATAIVKVFILAAVTFPFVAEGQSNWRNRQFP